MTDALDLIAQARARQEAAERDAQHWREKAEHARRRCRAVIAMAKLRPVPTPDVDADGLANWEHLLCIAEGFAEVVGDPYARSSDNDDDMTHETVKRMMAYRLQRMIEAAANRVRREQG